MLKTLGNLTDKEKAMDLSVNSVNLKKNKVSFEGLKSSYNAKSGLPVFTFNIPEYNPNQEDVYLELNFLKSKDEEGNYIKPKKDDKSIIKFNSNIIEIKEDYFKEKEIPAFAYRYKIINKKTGEERIALDPFRKVEINQEPMNIHEIGDNPAITPKGGSMRHSYKDSDGIVVGDELQKTPDKNFVRNHFNKLKGSLKGLTLLLKEGEFDPYRYVISTPEIGVDPISSHGYWPNNLYQVKNLQDFKDFNFELFKRGKGYVADGALTDQSIQSPLFHHVLKWGESSPFYNMMKLNGYMALGILPSVSSDNDDTANGNPYDHIGVKLINPPDKNYDENQPTYIQFFDDRLASEELINSNELIKEYDKAPNDHYQIVSYQDSVQPYYFEIDPKNKDAQNKIAAFQGKNSAMLLDIEDLDEFLTFDNFCISDNEHTAGAAYWDGNVDIVKMNLSNPENTPENRKGFYDARNYMKGIASFWTETVQSDLILRTAMLNSRDKERVAKRNDITKSEYETIKNSLSELYYPTLEKNRKSINSYISEFPIQAIETDPNMSAIFAQPQFSEEFLDEETYLKIKSIADKAIQESIPDKYKNNEDYKTYVVKTYANDILRTIYSSAMCPASAKKDGTIDKDELKKVNLKNYVQFAYDAEDEKNQVIKKLRAQIPDAQIEPLIQKMKSELEHISLDDFKLSEAIVTQGKGGLNWRFDAAKDIGDMDAIRNGEASFSEIWNGPDGVQSFWTDFISEVNKYNPSAYIISELTCLNDFYKWNDVKSMRLYDEELAEKFLINTADSVDKISKKIIESSDEIGPDDANVASALSKLSSILRNGEAFGNNEESLRWFSEYLANKKGADKKALRGLEATVTNMYIDEDDRRSAVLDYLSTAMQRIGYGHEYYAGVWQNHVPTQKEMQFLEQTGSTTTSNYSTYFNNISAFLGVDPENGYNRAGDAGNVEKIKETTEEFISLNQPNNVNLSHVFVDNHDKPRLLHTIPLDMELYMLESKKGNGDYNEKLENYKPLMKELTGRDDYDNIDTKAVAVADVMKRQIEKQFGTSPKAQKLKAALADLTNGVKVLDGGKTRPNKKRAEAFGVAPYEITIRDLFKNAGLEDEEDILNFHYGMMKDSMDMMERLWQMMGAIVGVPTLFNGTEFAQTGYETPSKNVYLGCRDQIRHWLKNDKRYENYYNKISAVSGLNQDKDFRALREGTPISCELTQDKGFQMWPLMKYDEKGSRVISVITNNLVPHGETSKNFENKKEIRYVDSIPVKTKDGIGALSDGTKLIRKVYDEKTKKYVTDNNTYLIKEGKIISPKGKIELDDTVAYFAVPNSEKNLAKYKY